MYGAEGLSSAVGKRWKNGGRRWNFSTFPQAFLLFDKRNFVLISGDYNMKLKHYEVVSRVEYLHEPVGDIVRRYRTIKKYAYILHDKDPDVSPHYHIYINFGGSGVDSKIVAEWFGLQESQVNKVKGRASDMLLYLTHGQPSQKNKYQYSPSEVIANFDFEEEIRKAQIIGNFDKYSYAYQLNYINSLPVEEKCKNYDKLKKLWDLHCKILSMNPDRKLEVIFLHGKTGTGKTFNAKMIAKKLGYDICISSAKNDPWQDYLGQACVICDDARDQNFEFEDLLKLLDNNTSSTVQARYGNKVLNCKMMIFTSSVPLAFWYRNLMYYRQEDLKQLYRRINAYVEITDNEILLYDKIDDAGRPSGLPVHYKNAVAELKKTSNQNATNFARVFSEIFEEADIGECFK